jgi:hypothetical protein
MFYLNMGATFERTFPTNAVKMANAGCETTDARKTTGSRRNAVAASVNTVRASIGKFQTDSKPRYDKNVEIMTITIIVTQGNEKLKPKYLSPTIQKSVPLHTWHTAKGFTNGV